MIVECRKCKSNFLMGVNGTVYGCDKCTGVERDKNGYAWKPGEQEHVYEPVGGTEKDRYAITREQAFNKR